MTDRLTLDDPAFGRLFDEIQESWFRLETLQHYDVSYEQEPFDAFQAGRPMPHDPADAEWTQMIRQHISQGRRLQRVHIITEPLSPYIEYELTWGYKAGHAGGEDIRLIVAQENEWPDDLPANHDFWFLDDNLWIMQYDAHGQLTFVERTAEPGSVGQHRRWMDTALRQSITLDKYLKRTPSLQARATEAKEQHPVSIDLERDLSNQWQPPTSERDSFSPRSFVKHESTQA